MTPSEIVAQQFSNFFDDLLTHASKQAMKKLFPGGVAPTQRRKLQPQKRTAKPINGQLRGIDLGNGVEYFPAPTMKGRK